MPDFLFTRIPHIYLFFGIRERAQLAGGECHIASAPGEGTTLVVEEPLPASEEGEDGAR